MAMDEAGKTFVARVADVFLPKQPERQPAFAPERYNQKSTRHLVADQGMQGKFSEANSPK